MHLCLLVMQFLCLLLMDIKDASVMSAKYNSMRKDMEEFAKNSGQPGCTQGTLTPMRRFLEDTDVPQKTRYEVPSDIVNSTYKASAAHKSMMDDWMKEMERVNAALEKEDESDANKEKQNGVPHEPAHDDEEMPNVNSSQQSEYGALANSADGYG